MRGEVGAVDLTLVVRASEAGDELEAAGAGPGTVRGGRAGGGGTGKVEGQRSLRGQGWRDEGWNLLSEGFIFGALSGGIAKTKKGKCGVDRRHRVSSG